MTDLLEAVEALTKPSRTKVVQDDGNVVTVELPSLLDQLDAAIRGSIVGIGGSGSLANERNMLNGDALHKAMTIKSVVKDWARMAGVKPVHGATVTEILRRWYVAYVGKSTEHTADRFYLGQLTGWAEQITAMFNPPRVRELPDPCPDCHAVEWENEADGLMYLRPLQIQFQPDLPDLISNAKGICRACPKTWSARELAYEIENARIE